MLLFFWPWNLSCLDVRETVPSAFVVSRALFFCSFLRIFSLSSSLYLPTRPHVYPKSCSFSFTRRTNAFRRGLTGSHCSWLRGRHSSHVLRFHGPWGRMRYTGPTASCHWLFTIVPRHTGTLCLAECLLYSWQFPACLYFIRCHDCTSSLEGPVFASVGVCSSWPASRGSAVSLTVPHCQG